MPDYLRLFGIFLCKVVDRECLVLYNIKPVSYTHLDVYKRQPEGTGVIAGGPARSVLEMAGIKNIRTKSLGSNNKTNVVLATLAGLTSLKTPEEFARLRGKSVEEIVG